MSSAIAFEADESIITLTATAAEAVIGDQTVSVVIAGKGITTDDYALSAAEITIPDGQTSGSLVLTVRGDQRLESDEVATVSLSGYSDGIVAGDTVSGELRLVDDSRPAIDQSLRYREGNDEFSWQPVVGAATWQIWLSQISPRATALDIETDLVGNSWHPIESLGAGTYRFWVRAFDDGGNASDWSVGYTFEVSPSLTAPFGTTFDRRPVFNWEEIPFADSYEIFVRDNQEIIRHSGISDTSWQPTVELTGPEIRWWIRPDGSPGNRGWSDVGELRIDGRSNVITAMPLAGEDAGLEIRWVAVQMATRCILHIQRSDGSEVVLREDHLTDNSFTSTSLSTGTYRAWIKAIDSSDSFASGRWSKTFEFSLASANESETDDSSLISMDSHLVGSPLLVTTENGHPVVSQQPSMEAASRARLGDSAGNHGRQGEKLNRAISRIGKTKEVDSRSVAYFRIES